MNDAIASPRAALDASGRRLGLAVLGAKLRVARNRIAVTRRRAPVLTSIQFGIAIPAVVALTSFLTIGFASAMSQAADTRGPITILAMMVALGCVGAFVGSSATALQALYLADDIPFLLTLPIPLRTLYASKLIEATSGALLPMLLSVSAIAGYGLSESAGPLFWLLGPLTAGCLVVTATACSVMTISGVTRYTPPRRARLFLLAISMVIIAVTGIAMLALAPRPGTIGAIVGTPRYEPLWQALAWTPAGWTADALGSAAGGQWRRALLMAGGVASITGLALICSFQAFRRTFIRGLARTAAVQAAQPSRSVTRWLDSAASLLPRGFGPLVLKEWLVLFRDLRRLSGAAWPVGIVLLYSVVLGRGDSSYGSGEFAFWSTFGTLVLLPWGLSLGISVYSYGSEGRNFHLLRALPFSASRIFAAKVFASLLPVGAFSLGIASATLWLRDAPLGQSLMLIALMAWMVGGLVVIDTASAAIAPNFETDQVQRTIGLTGRLFSFAMGSAFALASLLAAARIVLFASREPEGLADVLHLRLGGVEPFGWPLVIVCAVVALSVVAVVSAIAVKQTDRLIRAGF